ncbi:MAG: SGNH/GDSL hydrolase family protein [Oscillospiraceae bacterium]|nr:SGNH/GDSL hydrolase family protein [Oscillospiraceae bacterium]
MISEEIRSRIAAAAVHSTGTGIPWQAMLQKKELKLGFIGGSVTRGYANGAVFEKPYPALLCDTLRARGMNVSETVCAAPGMNCMIGNLLTDRFVLSQQPDLVVVEFAINETTLPPSIHAFESLLRKLLTAPQPPVVCILVLRNASGYSCEPYMVPIAEHYGLPCVVLREGLNPELEQGTLQWAEYADEESHPNPDGHRLIADCLLQLLDRAKDAPPTEPVPLPEPWLGAPFTALRFLTPDQLTDVKTDCPTVPKDNWAFPTAFRISPEHGAWSLTVTGTALVLYYEVNCLPEYGDCRVLLDGKPMPQPVLHGNSIYGWGNILHFTVFRSEQPQTHTVTLEPIDGDFYLAAAGIC